MADHGPVISIKLNPTNHVLSVQRSKTQVDFLNVASPEIEYSQAAKARGCNILGFLWTSPTEIVFVTDLGVELYSVTPEKRHIKYLRSSSFPTSWFVSCPRESFLATAPTTEATSLQVWALRSGSCYKLGSVESEVVVKEREAAMLRVYNQSYLALSIGEEVREVRLHKLGPDSVTWSYTLVLQPGPGPLGLQVVDNLVLLHSQAEGRSRIYDLQLVAKEPAVEVEGPAQLYPSLPATAICRQDSGHSQPLPYSPSWVVFRPNVLVDARTGHMWRVILRLEGAHGDPLTTAKLLLHRESGKTPLLRSWLPSTLPLNTLAQILDQVVAALGKHLTQAKPPPPVVLDQPDLFTHLFQGQEEVVGVDRLQAVLLELLLCLNKHQVPPRQFLHELLINLSVKSGKFYQLHQILQYGVIGDSKQIACLLLSLEAAYSPAKQLALDMMARLGTATEEMIEIFLAEGRLVSALQLVRANSLVDTVSARKFLEAADKTGDKRIFFTVFSFFEERNLRMRGSGKFSRGEQCDPYVQKFKTMFLDPQDQVV